MKTFLQRAMMLTMGMVIVGCAGTSVKKEAFARPQKLAVVTITGAAHGLYTGNDEDAKILAEAAPACLGEIAKSANVRLLPAKAVLSSKAYAAIKDDGAPFMQQLVPGYKHFSPEDEQQNLKALAKEVHADGFLILSLNYDKSESGVGLGLGRIGLSIGSVKPVITYVVAGVTPSGEKIWQDMVRVESEDGITTVMGIGSYASLVPKLTPITRSACQQSVKNLADQIAAK